MSIFKISILGNSGRRTLQHSIACGGLTVFLKATACKLAVLIGIFNVEIQNVS